MSAFFSDQAHDFNVMRTEARRTERSVVMQDAQRYRANAAKCLLAARQERQLSYRTLHLSMATSWLSLARRDEVMDDVLANGDTAPTAQIN